MKSKCRSNDEKQVQPAVTSSHVDESMILAMLESLADSLESKAEEITDRDDDSAKIRGDALKDIAAAIRERFLP